MKTLVFEYGDHRGNSASIYYDAEKNFYVNVFSTNAENHFREWMYRVSNRLNEYLKKGIGPDRVVLKVGKSDAGNVTVNYEILSRQFDVEIYITRSNELVFRNSAKASNFIHVTDRMQQAIQILREELASKSKPREITCQDIVLVDSASDDTNEAGAM